MSLTHSPKIVTDGLVLYYDAANTKKSWKGAPTTNVYPEPSDPFAFASTGHSCTLSRETNFKSPLGGIPLKMVTTGTDAYQSSYSGIGWNFGAAAVGDTWTISMYIKANRPGVSAGYFLFEGNPDGIYSKIWSSTTSKTTEWSLVTGTYTLTGLDTSALQMRLEGSDVFTVGDTIWFGDIQIEKQPFATPFIDGTRSNTESIIDLTNNNTITANSLTYAADNTFSFDGVSNHIDLSSDVLVSEVNQGWTAEYWFNTNDAGKIQHFNSAESDEFNANWLTINSNKLAVWNRDPAYWKYGSTVLQPNTWYQAVFICDVGGSNMRFYINGMPEGGDHVGNVWTSTYSALYCRYIGRYEYTGVYSRYFVGKIPSMKMYNRALAPDEVKQNFESLRGRYGI